MKVDAPIKIGYYLMQKFLIHLLMIISQCYEKEAITGGQNVIQIQLDFYYIAVTAN